MAKHMEVHGWTALTSMLTHVTCLLQRCASIGGSVSATSTTSLIIGSVTSGSKRYVPVDLRCRYPVCTGGKRAGPPEDCGGAWAYLQRVDQHHIPLDAMAIVATALEACWTPTIRRPIREVIGDPETFREAVTQLDAYLQFQPEHVDRRDVNAQLRALIRTEGTRP